jgi:hypothetical protein
MIRKLHVALPDGHDKHLLIDPSDLFFFYSDSSNLFFDSDSF